jgi:hypothetical protein
MMDRWRKRLTGRGGSSGSALENLMSGAGDNGGVRAGVKRPGGGGPGAGPGITSQAQIGVYPPLSFSECPTGGY